MRSPGPVLWVFLLALAVRLAVAGSEGISRPPVKDETNYVAIARSLLRGEGFGFEVTREAGGRPVTRRFTSLRPPLYPALLAAAAGGNVIAGRILSALLGAAAAALLVLFCRRLLPRGPSLLAGGLLAVWPAAVWISGRLLTEPLYLVLVLGFAAALLSRRVLLAGVLLGGAVLTRPGGLLLLLPGLAHLALAGPRSRGAFLRLLLPALLVPLPWVARNAMVHGRPLLTTNLGVTFFGGNCDAARADPVPGRWHRPEESLVEDPPDLGYFGWSALTEAESDRRFLSLGLRWIREHPGDWIRLLGSKAVRFFDPDPHSAKGDRRLKRRLGWATLAPLLILALLGAGALRRRWRDLALPVGLVAVPFFLSLVFYGDARSRIPALPGLLFFGSAGWGWVGGRLRGAFRGAGRGRTSA